MTNMNRKDPLIIDQELLDQEFPPELEHDYHGEREHELPEVNSEDPFPE